LDGTEPEDPAWAMVGRELVAMSSGRLMPILTPTRTVKRARGHGSTTGQ